MRRWRWCCWTNEMEWNGIYGHIDKWVWPHICSRIPHWLRSFSSVGLEHGSYESGVTGSNPVRSIFYFYKITILIIIIYIYIQCRNPVKTNPALVAANPPPRLVAANPHPLLAAPAALVVPFKVVDEARPHPSPPIKNKHASVMYRCEDAFINRTNGEMRYWFDTCEYLVLL